MKSTTGIVAALIAVLGIALGTGVYIGSRSQAVAFDMEEPLTPFSMHEVQTNRPYSSDNGRVKLLSFVLTNCPDGTCPLTMLDFADLQDALTDRGLFGTDVELLSITFDPDRDTPEEFAAYAGAFNANPDGWRFLRADDSTVRAVADELNYVYALGDDGSAVHAVLMYLVDRDHQVRAVRRMTTSNERMDFDSVLRELVALAGT
ncbi:MAG: SCO family protein [Spirochaetaceae bacterium]|nr:MAG: SCO family protein [Spirochaetaceae bacterium]